MGYNLGGIRKLPIASGKLKITGVSRKGGHVKCQNVKERKCVFPNSKAKNDLKPLMSCCPNYVPKQ